MIEEQPTPQTDYKPETVLVPAEMIRPVLEHILLEEDFSAVLPYHYEVNAAVVIVHTEDLDIDNIVAGHDEAESEAMIGRWIDMVRACFRTLGVEVSHCYVFGTEQLVEYFKVYPAYDAGVVWRLNRQAWDDAERDGEVLSAMLAMLVDDPVEDSTEEEEEE